MATSSSFASRFPEAKFRDAIRNAMKMGMPEDEHEQVHWYWKRVKEFVSQDPAKEPYDWTATPVVDDPGNPDIADTTDGSDQFLIVDYTLAFQARPAGSVSTVLGEIDTTRALIEMFDVDYEQVKTADYVMIGDSTYRIQFSEPAQGLFGVTMWTVVCEAEDQA